MNVMEVFENPGLFAVGLVWMMFHVGLMFLVAKIIKAPYFFLAVGSKANIGGAASAPVVAAAFHPALAPWGFVGRTGICARNLWSIHLWTFNASSGRCLLKRLTFLTAELSRAIPVLFWQ